MNEELLVSPDLVIQARALEWRFSRSSGPGGQSVNTSDSRVELIFDLVHSDAFPPELHRRALHALKDELVNGNVIISSSRYRSQLNNRNDAQQKLVRLLQNAIAPPPPVRRKTRPSRSAVQERLNEKTHRSQTKRWRRPPSANE